MVREDKRPKISFGDALVEDTFVRRKDFDISWSGTSGGEMWEGRFIGHF